MLRIALLLALLAACPAPRAPAPDTGTRLVVLVVIDQFPEWAFEAKRRELRGGFDRLLSEGEWRVGRHPSAATLTSSGHALLGTGAPPATSGILANEWWHRDLHRLLRSVEDETGATSAKWLKVPGLADALAAAHRGGKAVSVSLKARAAILPLGHTGLPIWYDPKVTAWVSLAPPPWLADWNHTHPIAEHLHDVWTPLDLERMPELTGTADDRPGEVGEKGFGPTFPHDLGATKNPADAIEAAPIGNDLELDLATEAIEREHLGADSVPDLLVISLSSNDLVGHGFGHESWESWDLVMRLDQRLGQFLVDLDRLVGAGRWSMILTSDHGASPLPEAIGGGRMTFEQLRVAANNAAAAVLGPGQWVVDATYPNVFFSDEMLAQPKEELVSATKRVIFALRSFPGLERVDAVAGVAGHCDRRTGDARALCLTFDPERSGDVFYLPAKGWIFEEEDDRQATAHGSMHDYDRLVPAIIVGPDRVPHAPAEAPSGELDMTEVAPTLAKWLGVPPPNPRPQ